MYYTGRVGRGNGVRAEGWNHGPFWIKSSVATTPGARIVQAVGDTGVYQALNPLVEQNG